MKTEKQIQLKLKELREELEADDFPWDDEDETDWIGIQNRIIALEWVLGDDNDSI